jgi:neutral trehalase
MLIKEHWDRMTTAFVDFNGVVPEKFDAVRLSHLVDAEYGNQGIDFKMVPREGFGWMNGTLHISVAIRSSASSHRAGQLRTKSGYRS